MSIAIRTGTKEDLRDPRILELIRTGVFRPTAEKVTRLLEEIRADSGRFYICTDDPGPVGLLVAVETSKCRFEIRNIIVEEAHRRRGVGRRLVYALIASCEMPVIGAETDDDAVAFYHSMGFRVQSLGEKYPGVIRYRCLYDPMDWVNTPLAGIVDRCKQHELHFWVSGGWAIDLHLGHQTREHADLDISILRRDVPRLKEVFGDWEIFQTHAPGLRYWNGTDSLDSVPNVWIREGRDSPWTVEVMFQESEGTRWLYRRNQSVCRAIAEIGKVSADGIPYLRPAVQLLFKGGGSSYRDKDVQDLKSVLPTLSLEEKQWLLESLRTEFPGGHDWIRMLES